MLRTKNAKKIITNDNYNDCDFQENSMLSKSDRTGLPNDYYGMQIQEKEVCFEEVLEDWITNHMVQQKGSTIHRYRYLINTHIAPELGQYDVKKINSSVINRFLNQKLTSGRKDGKGGLSNAYVKSMMLIIKSSLRLATDEGLCAPLKTAIMAPRVEKRDLYILSHDEQAHLEQRIQNNINETTIGILISLYTGLRIGEICALAWEDVSLENRIIHVKHTVSRVLLTNCNNSSGSHLIIDTPKTPASKRDIPIATCLFDLLVMFKANAKSKFVVSDKKSFVSPRTFEYRYHKVLKSCDIRAVNYHILRHTFATRCIETGMDVKSLSEILGHSNVSITLNTYVHSSMEFKRLQMEKLSDIFV